MTSRSEGPKPQLFRLGERAIRAVVIGSLCAGSGCYMTSMARHDEHMTSSGVATRLCGFWLCGYDGYDWLR